MKFEARNSKSETSTKFKFLILISVLLFQSVNPSVIFAASTTSTFTTSLTTTGVVSSPPTVPTNLAATPVSDTRIDLSWTASLSGGSYPVAGYRIFRNSVFLATTSATVYADLGLTASTTYSYTVEAFDTNMQLSGQTASVATTTLHTPPPLPSPSPVTVGGTTSGGTSGTQLSIYSMQIAPSTNDATVSFLTNMPAEAKIYWGRTTDYESGSLSELIYGTSHELRISGLDAGTSYFVRIEVMTNAGTSVSNTAAFSTVGAITPVSPLPNPANFKATATTNEINLSWTNPSDPRFNEVRVVRSETFFPVDQNDGVPVYEGNGSSFTDTNATVGKTYYYAIFAKGTDGEFSSGALAKSRIAPAGEVQIPTNTSTDPFANLPESQNVDPKIQGLSLSDFDFIQDGKVLQVVNGGTIAIDGTKNLTIRLKYEKVPEVLKTIAFTLSDPADPSKVFPFLLRINADKTYYESTIGALGRSGTYGMSIVILDYENKGLKRIRGDLQALAIVAIPAQIAARFDPLGFLFLFVLILLVLLILLLLRRHAKKQLEEQQVPVSLPVNPSF